MQDNKIQLQKLRSIKNNEVSLGKVRGNNQGGESQEICKKKI